MTTTPDTSTGTSTSAAHEPVRIGIVSVSDRASSGVYVDQGLPALQDWLTRADKDMPGFGEQMRQISLKFVPTAILSRQVAVIREQTLIINLPGQPKSIRETLEGLRDAEGASVLPGIFAAVPYCLDLIGGPYLETVDTVCKAFRPKSAQRPAAAA
jgi:molybdopterin adenylyltransferase